MLESASKDLVLLDVDGTIIDEHYRLTVKDSDFVAALTRTQEAGITIGINSDSALPTIRSWAQRWGIRGPLLGEQSVICLPDENHQLMPAYDGLTRFQEIRDAFILELIRRPHSGERYVVLVGDVNSIVDRMPAYETEGDETRTLIGVNGLRQFSLSFFVRGRTHDGWAEREDALANGPPMKRVLEILKEVANGSEDFKGLWGSTYVDNNPRYGICIVHRGDVHKRTPVERLRRERAYRRVYMIGDSERDNLGINDVVQCAVGNASTEYKKHSRMIATQNHAAGVIELLEMIVRER